jgi:hypothetical protein
MFLDSMLHGWMDSGIFKKKQLEAIEIPSGINVYIAMENHHV